MDPGSNVERWERKHALPRAVVILLIVFAVLFGGLFTFLSISGFWGAHASRNWSKTKGLILKSVWIPGKNQSGHAQIDFNYSVDGRDYRGDHILAGHNEYGALDEKDKVKQYQVGMTVPVYYDPANPTSSCLEPGVLSSLPFIDLGIGLFSIAVAISFAWRLSKRRPIPYTREPPPVIEEYEFIPKD
jgi:hypothetical protein